MGTSSLNAIGANAGNVITMIVALFHYASIGVGLFAIFKGVYMWYSTRNGRGGDDHKHAWYWVIGGIAVASVGAIMTAGSTSIFGTTDPNVSNQWSQNLP